MAKNEYDGMTTAQKNNEKKYLDNLISKGGGDGEWAKGQLTKLASSSESSDPDAGSSIDAYLGKYGVPSGSSSSSGSGSYKVGKADKPDRVGYVRSASELADLYDLNYDVDSILDMYNEATDKKYALKQKEAQMAENAFYTNNANANATLLDTLKKATSSSIATGASRGLASAEQLGLMMDAQQEATAGATTLAQDRAKMADEMGIEYAQNIINAMEYSDELKRALATVSGNLYNADAQYDAGLLDFAAKNRATDAEYQTNANAQDLQGKLAMLEDLFNRDKMNNDNAQAALNRQNALDIAAYNASAYNGNGSNYKDEIQYRVDVEREAIIEGNFDKAVTNYQNEHTDYNKAVEIAEQNPGLLISCYYGGAANVPNDVNNIKDFEYKVWNAGDQKQLILALANQDNSTKSWEEKKKEAEKKCNQDRQFQANKMYGGYSNASKIKLSDVDPNTSFSEYLLTNALYRSNPNANPYKLKN